MYMYAFDVMRPLQVDVIDKVIEAFEDFKYVAVEAPTGTGKSAIVVSTALRYGNSYINTSSKLLQDQYLGDFDYVKTVRGKSNFRCVDPEMDSRIVDLTADAGRCCFQSGYPCKAKPKKEEYIAINRGRKRDERIFRNVGNGDSTHMGPTCEYFHQKFEGLAAGHTVFNYKYFFSLLYYTGELNSRELLVFDEAHNIENEVLDFISINIKEDNYRYFIKELFDEFLEDNTTIPEFPKQDNIDVWLEYLRASKLWMREVWTYYEDRSLPDDVKKTLSRFESTYNKVKYIVQSIEQNKENWIVDFKQNDGGGVSIKPIETGQYIKPMFELANKVLFTSATILDKQVFASMIGVNENEIAFIRVEDSPFPKENRPIYARNIGSMGWKTMESLLPVIVKEIDDILGRYNESKGIIHVTNYRQLEYIKTHSKNRHRFTTTASGTMQSDVLAKHRNKPNSVLLSPSMQEGVDLKDDISRFQIIVKMPYMDLSDKRISIKQKRSWKWYNWYTVLRLIQMMGRSIRHKDDYADTYILDSKFNEIVNNTMVPRYVKEAVI